MSRQKTRSWVGVAAAMLIAPSAVISACDDDATSGSSSSSGGPDAAAESSAVASDGGSGVDVSTVRDTGAGAADARDAEPTDAADEAADGASDAPSDAPDDVFSDAEDAGADASDDADAADSATAVTFTDGTYAWGVWTCSDGVRTTDIKAYAMSIGIASVDEIIAGSNGTVHSNYSGAPACTRITTFTIAYPSSGMITTTTSANYTCSMTCDPGKCTAGTQPSFVDTYAISVNGNTVTETRVLDAAFIAQTTLQKIAGCQVGDTEIGTFIKQ